MLLQDAPANTAGYMIAGFIIIFGMMALYTLSLYLRQRSAKKKLKLLENQEEEN